MHRLATRWTRELRRRAGGKTAVSRPRPAAYSTPAIKMDTPAASSSNGTATPPGVTVPAIKLEDREVAVLDLVDGFTKHLAETRSDLPPVECRVAGGWVRDKVRPALTLRLHASTTDSIMVLLHGIAKSCSY